MKTQTNTDITPARRIWIYIAGSVICFFIGYSFSPAQLAMAYTPGTTQDALVDPDEYPATTNQELHGKALSLFEKGFYYQEKGRTGYTKAIEAYKKAWEITPNNADLNYQMGFIYERLGDADNAVVHYREANRLDTYYRLLTLPLIGHLYHIRGEFGNAIKVYSEALEELHRVKGHKKEVQEQVVRIELAIRQCHNALEQSLDQKVILIVQP